MAREPGGKVKSPTFLADTSALTRMRYREVDEVLTPLIESGSVARCGVVDIEMLYIARALTQLIQMRENRALAFPLVPMVQDDFERAIDIMVLLAEAGKHRSAKLPDLLIAAAAERAGLTLLHYDADFDHIATITQQPTMWVVPRGTVP